MSEISTPYINIQTDFGFKQVFGQEINKPVLIRFLNILFEGRISVRDVIYHDKEIIPSESAGKRIIYDVYCTVPARKSESPFFPQYQKNDDVDDDASEYHFILEMQNVYVQPFEERIVFYASKMISGQGRAGWDYELAPVFVIAVTDFNFSHMSAKLVRDVMLVDRDSMEPLTDKLHILLCSLREVAQTWNGCRTELEEMLFLIKNMENMDSTSLAYREGKYPEVFEAARSSRLRPADMVEYRKSLDRLRDYQRGLEYAVKNARREASEEARAEGISEGIEMERRQSIRTMLALGISPEKIAESYGIGVDEVMSIAANS